MCMTARTAVQAVRVCAVANVYSQTQCRANGAGRRERRNSHVASAAMGSCHRVCSVMASEVHAALTPVRSRLPRMSPDTIRGQERTELLRSEL